MKPSLFNIFEPKKKKVKLSWSNIKSDSSYNTKKRSNTKSSWSNFCLDASYKIENSINNKTSWWNLKSDSYNIENNSSKNTSKNLDRASIHNKKEITTEENKNKPWSIKFFHHVQAIEYNNLWFCVPKEWGQQGKGVKHPLSEKKTKYINTSNRICSQSSLANG